MAVIRKNKSSFKVLIFIFIDTVVTFFVSTLILKEDYFGPYNHDIVISLLALLLVVLTLVVKTIKLRLFAITVVLLYAIGFAFPGDWTTILSFLSFCIEIALGIYLVYCLDKLVIPLLTKFNLRVILPNGNRILQTKTANRFLFSIKHDSKQLLEIIHFLKLGVTNDLSSKLVSERRYFKHLTYFYSLAIVIIYLPLTQSYFIQDEWYNFGLFNQFVDRKLGLLSIFKQQFTNPKMYGIHFTPLWNTFFFIEYQLFGLHYILWIIASLILHLVTTLLLAKFVLEITRSRLIALLAGLYFAISFAHAEAVYWANTHIQTQGATICAIIALLFWFRALKKNSALLYIVSLIFTAIGLLLKETVFALFPILVVMTLLYGNTRAIKKSVGFILAGFFVYMPYRIIFAKFLYTRDTSNLDVGPLIPPGIFDIGAQSYRLFTYPMKAVAQEFFTTNAISHFAENITGWSYPTYAQERLGRGSSFLLFVQSAGSDIVMIYIGFFVIILTLIMAIVLHRKENTRLTKALLVAIAVIVSSIIPLLFIAPWLSKLFAYVTFLDSRHLYFTSIGASILFGIFIYFSYLAIGYVFAMKIFSRNLTVRKYRESITMSISIICFGLIMAYLVVCAQTTIGQVVAVGSERHHIADAITAAYPTILPKTIFLIKSNKPYYGLAESVPPFQTNFGYTLLHLYNGTQHYPISFFTTGFLLQKGIAGEDYRQEAGKGFGYFLSEKTLVAALRKFNLTSQSVFAFSYDGVAKQTTDITIDTRAKLTTLLTPSQATINWQEYNNEALHMRFRFPQDYILFDITNSDDNILSQVDIFNPEKRPVIRIIVRKKPDTIGVRDFVSALTDSQGMPLSPLKDANLALNQFDTWPSVVYESVREKTYLFNTQSNLELKSLTFYKTVNDPASFQDHFLETLEFSQ